MPSDERLATVATIGAELSLAGVLAWLWSQRQTASARAVAATEATQIAQLQSQTSQLQSQVSGLQGQVSQLTGEYQGAEQQLSQTQTALQAAQAQASHYKNLSTSLQAQLASVQSQYQAAQASLASDSQQLQALQAQVQSLQASLAQAQNAAQQAQQAYQAILATLPPQLVIQYQVQPSNALYYGRPTANCTFTVHVVYKGTQVPFPANEILSLIFCSSFAPCTVYRNPDQSTVVFTANLPLGFCYDPQFVCGTTKGEVAEVFTLPVGAVPQTWYGQTYCYASPTQNVNYSGTWRTS